MYCEKCGAQFAQGAKFCAQCGAPRSTTAPVIKPFREDAQVAATRIAQLVDDGETYDPRYGHDQVPAKSAGWTPPGFRRGRNGPRILATITYALLAWGSLRTIGHLVAGLFYVGGTGLAIALWYDYRGLRSRVFAKPGRPWFTSGALVTVAALAWFAARGLDQTPQASTATRIPSEPVIMATDADPAIQASHDEATALLGEARIKRDAGEFGLALELARQAQAKWPSSAEIKAYLAETGVQATAGMKSAAAQATASAKEASVQATAAKANQMPDEQRRFIDIVVGSQSKERAAANDMQKGGIKADRDKALCDALPQMQVQNWVGALGTISANSDGFGILSVEITKDVFVTTWNNAFSDMIEKTLIQPGTPLFNTASQLKKGSRVKFSGMFFRASGIDCLREGSLTLSGKLRSPEFIFRFQSFAAD